MNSKFYGRNVKTINIKKYLENISEKNIKAQLYYQKGAQGFEIFFIKVSFTIERTYLY